MLNKTRILITTSLFALIVCALLVILSKQIVSNTVKAQNELPKLSMEISSDQDSYLQAEPISINVKLSNRTNQPISWRGYLGVGPNFNFLVRDTNGVKPPWEGWKIAAGIYSILRVMPPGEQIQQDVLLDHGLSQVLFPRPGRYDLQFEFVYRTDSEGSQQVKILSNSISITINEPQGKDLQAYEYLKGPLEQARRQPNVRTLAQIEQEFVDRYSNTVYAKYIIFQLANTYQTLGEDEKAFRELCKISGQNFYYSKDVQKKVYRIDEKLRPVVMLPLPENAPLPVRPHPCTVPPN